MRAASTTSTAFTAGAPGSVFVAILLHASVNPFGIVRPLFASPLVAGSDLAILTGTAAPALLIVVLTLRQPGSQPERDSKMPQ